MSKSRRQDEQIELPFVDLPLQVGDEDLPLPLEPSTSADPSAARQAAKPDDPLELRLFPPSTPAEDDPEEAVDDDEPLEPSPASLRDLALAGLADLSAILVVLGVVALGVKLMGVALLPADMVPFTVLGLIFSFLYWVIPLAFWGQTPGMAWLGLMSHSTDDEPLTFGQAIWRWIGALLTVAFAGLPLLLALGGRSLSDRLSSSKTIAL